MAERTSFVTFVSYGEDELQGLRAHPELIQLIAYACLPPAPQKKKHQGLIPRLQQYSAKY
jgi:hypothetical protein